MELTHVDLFSGTGAFSIGAEAAGFKTVAFSEIDPFCSALLKQHRPRVTNYGDIRNVPGIKCTLLTGGFPCQPFSIAGRRKGADDDRYLWPAMLAVIERCEPNWIIGENVVNIKNMVLPICLDDLEKRGYQSKAFDIPSCAVGLPSMERHIWIVAARNEFRVAGHPEINGGRRKCMHEWDHNGVTKESRRWHLPTSRLLRSRKGFPNFVDRIRAIGNSVPPPIAQIFCEAIYQQIA